MSVLTRIFGDANKRVIQKLEPTVQEISALEPELEKLSDDELKNKTQEFKALLGKEDSLDDILPEAFATVREAAKRKLGQRHFDVQLLGGIVLHQGKITEMKTGEGKTLVATLPLYLNALSGQGTHLVTPNDYLSRVGAGWMGPVYHALDVSVGVITHDWSGIYDPFYQDSQAHGDERLNHFRQVTRRDAYGADITYGTNNEFGFDYLLDNMAYSPEQMVQRGHHFAIVDEVDSILIDEARTPLIISAPDTDSGELYRVFARITPQLKEGRDYNVDEKFRAVSLAEEGIEKVEQLLGIENIYTEKGIKYVHHLEQALRAQALFHRDKDYVVRDNEIIIVDEFTGRLMPGRRWSEGLHQAVEAKEGVSVQKESRTLATITFQNYFRMYEKLAGMTGTAATSAEEFHKVYNLEVLEIPTHKPMIRLDHPDRVYQSEQGKLKAVAAEVKARHEKGQPILIGTVSIEKNERLAEFLKREGVPYEVLNAKNHEREAEIIAQAGKKGRVTLATNIAGRGVDIILGGSPLEPSEAAEVKEAGGLFVLGTERHEARRIDNQLRGRSGRQGDPGGTQFFASLEDELMRIFGSERIRNMMGTFGIPEDQPIEHKLVSRAIESAQEKIEGFNFDARKHVLEYDDVMNKQRKAIYERRRKILFGSDEEVLEAAKDHVSKEINILVDAYTGTEEWNLEELSENIKARFGALGKLHEELSSLKSKEEIGEKLQKLGEDLMEQKEKEMGGGFIPMVRQLLLQSTDMLWMEHLEVMEYMRSSVRLRAYGQRDPLIEYKNEAIRLFRELEFSIRTQFSHLIFKAGAQVQATSQQTVSSPPSLKATADAQFGGSAKGGGQIGKVGRNDPCPCGAKHPDGRPVKYKYCHGKNV